MSLPEFVDRVVDREKRITVYGPSPPEGLSEMFETWNVRVEYEHLPTATEDAFLTVHEGEQFLGGTSAAALSALTAPTVGDPWGETDREESFRDLLSLLDDTLFSSRSRRQLLATSREFEERAWRRGVGALHAVFQSRSVFDPQREVYERLAGESDLTVHVYVPDAWASDESTTGRAAPAAGSVSGSDSGIDWHTGTAEELRETWLVAYDGGGEDVQKCALVAFEEGEGEYRGFWTYDPAIVDEVVDYLRRTYR